VDLVTDRKPFAFRMIWVTRSTEERGRGIGRRAIHPGPGQVPPGTTWATWAARSVSRPTRAVAGPAWSGGDPRGPGQLTPWGAKPLINPDRRTRGKQAVRQLFGAYVGPE
jgi:hypothetical protein